MLTAYPEQVRVGQLTVGTQVDLSDQPNFFRQDLREITANGIIGDARPATAAQGEHYWQAMTTLILNEWRAQQTVSQ
jgi:creatinine amidohydrolase/Fe(II)-dependent formamide hydrolase-like protein